MSPPPVYKTNGHMNRNNQSNCTLIGMKASKRENQHEAKYETCTCTAEICLYEDESLKNTKITAKQDN